MEKKITLIIPIYNVESYLNRCLNSIISQTYQNFEVILINDGSTDNSKQICEEFIKLDNRFRLINKSNEGVSIARNIGIQEATGEWLSFIDSDDWLEKDYLSTLLEENEIADLTFWGVNCHYLDNSQTSYIPHNFYSHKQNEIMNELCDLKMNLQNFEFFGYTWNKLFRTDIIKKYNINFIPNLTLREDEVFTLTYIKYIKSLRVKNIALYNYRITQKGLTVSKRSIKEHYLYAKNILKESEGIPNDSKLFKLETISALEHLIEAIIRVKVYSPKWLQFIKTLKNNLKKRDINIKYIRNKKLYIFYRYSNSFSFYIIAIIITIISRKK